jgi:two-component system, chemotaxis family, sensor kinase CheA
MEISDLKGKRILIVEDEEKNIYALSSFLEQFDFDLQIAGNGEEALSMISNGSLPDIILLDMMMPVMDGYDTLSALKENGVLKKIPVIAVTARAMKGDKEKCIEAGAWDYVSKPINLKLLEDLLIKYLS